MAGAMQKGRGRAQKNADFFAIFSLLQLFAVHILGA
jgi:hypothetical protein